MWISTGLVTGAAAILWLVAPMAFAESSKAPASPKAGSTQHERSEGATSQQGAIQTPDNCDDIKAGTGGPSGQAAAKQECQRSQHLGAGTGTSSGTGSGKRAPASGPR